MALPDTIFDIALRERGLGLALRLVIVMMVCLGTLATTGSLGLSFVVAGASHPLKGRLTVELPPPAEPASPIALARDKALTDLAALPDVASATPVAEEEITRLLRPWLDDVRTAALPVLIDVELKDNVDIEKALASIREALASIPGSTIDNHEAWTAHRIELLGLLGWLATMTALFAVMTLTIMVALIGRIALLMQRETISLLHLMGATDSGIARRFMISAATMTWPPALAGAALAAIPLGALVKLLSALDLAPGFGLPWVLTILAVVLTPVFATLVAGATAYFAARILARKAA